MAYRAKPKQEDPNALTRTRPPSTPSVLPPAAPPLQNPGGGAPRLPGSDDLPLGRKTTPSGAAPLNPGGRTTGPDYLLPNGPRMGTNGPITPEPNPFMPAGGPSPIWRNAPAPISRTSAVTPSTWNLRDVASAEPEVTKQIQDMLWQRFQAAPETERQSVFWQGVTQNPQLAAASFVRRMIDNMKRYDEVMNGTKPPAISTAVEATMANHEIRQWLSWVRGTRRAIPRGGR